MSLLQNGNLLKFVSDKVKGFEVKLINAVSGIYVVDTKGYIGIKINDYFSQNGSPYPGNYALVAKGPSYKDLGLGQVTFIDDIQGQVTIGDKTYRTVVMPDGKEWMAENLDFLPSDGSIEFNPNGNKYTPAATYYNRDEATYGWNGKKYGLLYNWYAAKALTIAGWHLPSPEEWNNLFTSIGGTSTAGIKLKSTTDWNQNGNGTDNYHFTVYPTGYYVDKNYYIIAKNCYFWTSTSSKACLFYNSNNFANIDDTQNVLAVSVRLVKDT